MWDGVPDCSSVWAEIPCIVPAAPTTTAQTTAKGKEWVATISPVEPAMASPARIA